MRSESELNTSDETRQQKAKRKTAAHRDAKQISSGHSLGEDAEVPKKRGVLRKIGRGFFKLTAADVLLRDSKRIRLRYPHLWRDIASGRWRKSSVAMEKTSVPAMWRTPLILWCMTLVLGAYTASMFVAAANGDAFLDALSVIGLVFVWMAAVFQAGTYTYAAWIYTKRRKQKL